MLFSHVTVLRHYSQFNEEISRLPLLKEMLLFPVVIQALLFVGCPAAGYTGLIGL